MDVFVSISFKPKPHHTQGNGPERTGRPQSAINTLVLLTNRRYLQTNDRDRLIDRSIPIHTILHASQPPTLQAPTLERYMPASHPQSRHLHNLERKAEGKGIHPLLNLLKPLLLPLLPRRDRAHIARAHAEAPARLFLLAQALRARRLQPDCLGLVRLAQLPLLH